MARVCHGATGKLGAMPTSTSRPLAVVTGASSGIGLELAKQFADNGFDLIVAAEDDELGGAAAELSAHGAQVDAVALNAGIGAGGAFTDTPLEKELRVIDLNVRSTVHLAKHVVRDMVARGEGRILFTSSIASTMPGTFQAVYNASKSFVQSFTLALRE